MNIVNFLNEHPTLNFFAYLNFCLVMWGISLYVYEKITPNREWKLIAAGNKAAAFSMGGVAIGIALPLCSLVTHSQGWPQMLGWSALSLVSQLMLWFILTRSAFPALKANIENGVESVGIILGAGAIALGALVASCVS